jgi:type I restriction enzyme S subunit
MAVEQLITQHIDTWTSALQTRSTAGRGSNGKIDLYGIKKLRELILELAVRGKLVPQDPNDEPASELLKHIAAEKAELVKQGKIKKQKPLPEISEEEKPFELPKGWVWARLSDISGYIQRGKGPKYAEHGSVKVVSQKCVQWSGFKLEQSRWITDESIHSYTEDRFLKDRDVLWNSTGAGGTAGRVIYLPVVKEKLVVDSHVTLIRTVRDNGQFISNYISTYGIQQRFDPKHSNTLLSGTTNQAELNSSVVTSFLVPFPPQMEQERINDKAAELMSLCDQLEQQSLTSLDAHLQLVETLLATLNDSQNAEELAKTWARISQHFDTLFTTESSIDALKQTILQLAVMGKLVPQDPNDEPASELLKRIEQEKAQLVKEGKIKKHPPVEPLGEPALLPRSWLNIVVQDFADIRLGSTPDRSEKKYWNGDIPWVSSGEVANEVILDTKEKITPEGFKNSSTSMIPTGSLLMAIIGQGKTRGQTAILGIDACTNQNVAAFVFNQVLVEPEYVWIWAKSKYLSHRGDGHGGAQPALNGKKVRSFIFPLAPIKEQQRIVSEVKRLNDICDTLQSRLQSAQQTQRHLADALTDAALN